jgi:hypothetical protein
VGFAIAALLVFGVAYALIYVLAAARSAGIKLLRFVAEALTITQRIRTSTLSSQDRSSSNREGVESDRAQGAKALLKKPAQLREAGLTEHYWTAPPLLRV